jgi:hypothetical protein
MAERGRDGRKNGRELYFLERGRLMAVAIAPNQEFDSENPTVPLQPFPGIVDYDVAAAGRFLVNIGKVGYNVSRIRILINWNSGRKQ